MATSHTQQHEHVTALQKQLRTLDDKIVRAADRLLSVDESLVDTLQERLMELKRQRAGVAGELSRVPAADELDPKVIAARLWKLDAILQSGDPAKMNAALKQIVIHIRLHLEERTESRKRYRGYKLVGGEIKLCTCAQPTPRSRRTCRFCTSLECVDWLAEAA